MFKRRRFTLIPGRNDEIALPSTLILKHLYQVSREPSSNRFMLDYSLSNLKSGH